MSLIRVVPLRSFFKFAPGIVIALFLITNLTGLLFKTVMAPASLPGAEEPEPVFIPTDMPTSGDAALDRVIFQTGERYGVDPRLLHAIIWKESGYRVDAKSPGGAQGLMQLLPATGRRFGCGNMHDAASNVDAGTRYVRWLLQRFDGSVALALAGYNAGEGSVDKYQGVPPFAQTQDYVRVICARYGKPRHPVLDPIDARREFHLVEELAKASDDVATRARLD